MSTIEDALITLHPEAHWKLEAANPKTEVEFLSNFVASNPEAEIAKGDWSNLVSKRDEIALQRSFFAYIDLRRKAYGERIAEYKGVKNADEVAVLGFMVDALVKAFSDDTIELLELKTIIESVKTDFPKNG